MSVALACGIDFGTSNSTVTVTDGREVVAVPLEEKTVPSPTLLYFGDEPPAWYGQAAIDQYLFEEMAGRLIQSIKRHLPAKTFEGTYVLGKMRSLEELVAGYLRNLRRRAEVAAGAPVTAALLGRPARFHEDDERDALAESRLRAAAGLAGFRDIDFQLEPIAAARQFERSLDEEVLCLVGDFGGGTSDFTVIRLSPARARKKDRSDDILGVAGVAVGGNDFDARLMIRHVLPHFGHNSFYQPFGKRLRIPTVLHLAITRWHTACLAGTDKDLNTLAQMLRTAEDPVGLGRLEELLREGWFYLLFQAVEATKIALSSQESATFSFKMGNIEIEESVARSDFEAAIGNEVNKLSSTVDALLASLSLPPDAIDVVFLTGGSSQIPAVRRLFTERFTGRIADTDVFTSVGLGLGVEAVDRLLP
ncbi:MAG: Hsp70 family protein [Myxococcota bacterium]